MHECEYASRLGAYHDGELPPEAAAAVEQHIKSCPACAAELARIRALSNLLKAAQPPQLPAAVLKRLHRRMDLSPDLSVHRMVRTMAAAAAAVLVTCSVILTAASGSTPTESMPLWEIAAVPQRAAESTLTTHEEQIALWTVRDLSSEDTHE